MKPAEMVAAVDRFAGGRGKWSDGLDQSVMELEAIPLDLAGLARLAGLGIDVRATTRVKGIAITITGGPPARLQLSFEGDVVAKLPRDHADALVRADTGGDLSGVPAVVGAEPVNVRLTLRATGATTHWVRTAEVLRAVLAGDGWREAVEALFTAGEGAVVVVQSAGDAWVRCPGLLIRGPDAPEAGETRPIGEVERDFHARQPRARPLLPPPAHVVPTARDGLDDLPPVLHHLAGNLCWHWLADDVVGEGPPVAVFDARQPVELELSGGEADAADDEVELLGWVLAGTGPDRRAAVRQALVHRMHGQGRSIAGAAAQIHSSAETLVNIAASDRMTEALSTRRSARDSAITAGRATADAARQAAAKSMERVTLQAIAVAGLVIAEFKGAIDAAPARNLLWVAFALLVISAGMSFGVEFKTARSLLRSFEADVEQYSEVLGRREIGELKSLGSVREAENVLWWAQIGAGIVFAAAFLGFYVAFDAI